QEAVAVGLTGRQEVGGAVVVAEQAKRLRAAAREGVRDGVLPACGVGEIACPKEKVARQRRVVALVLVIPMAVEVTEDHNGSASRRKPAGFFVRHRYALCAAERPR